MGFTIDISKFEKGFSDLVEKSAPKAIAQGLFKAGAELLHDAIYQPKTAPKDVGDLWGSASIQGDGPIYKLNKTPNPPGNFTTEKSSGESRISAGFNICYAAKWHELPPGKEARINWTRDKGSKDPGAKYLESKMARNGKKYLWIIGEHLKKVLGT